MSDSKTLKKLPNKTTLRAIKDVQQGKIHKAKDLRDLFEQLGIRESYQKFRKKIVGFDRKREAEIQLESAKLERAQRRYAKNENPTPK